MLDPRKGDGQDTLQSLVSVMLVYKNKVWGLGQSRVQTGMHCRARQETSHTLLISADTHVRWCKRIILLHTVPVLLLRQQSAGLCTGTHGSPL